MQRLVEGWTRPIKTELYEDGSPLVHAAKEFEVQLTGKDGVTQTLAVGAEGMSGSSFAIATESGKTVATFTPGAGLLLASKSPYRMRIKCTTDGYFAPNNEKGEQWVVYKV